MVNGTNYFVDQDRKGEKKNKNAWYTVIHGPKNNGQISFRPKLYWTN